MNRRKAVKNILLLIGVTAAGGAGFEWYRYKKKPGLAELANYRELLAELAETIIPATDSPGGKDAKVGDFIYKMVNDCSDIPSQNRFLYGLHDLENYCHSQYKQSFIKCTTSQREEILIHFENNDRTFGGIAGKIQRKLFGTSFFTTLKNYTVIGYCTSQQGATQGLAYDYVPGHFDACVPVRAGQRSWATK